MNLSRTELKNYIYENGIVTNGIYNFRKMMNKIVKKTIEENIKQYTTNCNSDRIMEKVYWIVNDLTSYPKQCKYCHSNITLFGEWKKAYKNIYCSYQCSADCPNRAKAVSSTNLKRYGAENAFGSTQIREKIKKTMIKRYGVDHNMKSERIRKKAKKTIIDRYGVEHALQSTKIMKKLKDTNIERYGVENVFENDKIKAKIKSTNIKRYGFEVSSKSNIVKEKIKSTSRKKYGVEYPLLSPIVQEKKKATNLKKYGVENPLSLPVIQDKIKKTNLKKYGVENVFASYIFKDNFKEIQDKIKKTNLKKYGVKYASQKHYSKELLDLLSCKENLEKAYKIKDMYKIANEYDIPWPTINTYLIKYKIRTKWKSSPEIAICNWLSELNISVISNDRTIIKPKELDIVITCKKIAIEYCGLYWHSTKYRDNNYHIDKLNKTNNKGYRLITIFEDEWINKRDICKDRLKHILGINDTTCYARQTIIKEISNNEHRDFLITYHIQGFIDAKIKLGAFYKDELVAVMTFGKKRRALGNKIQKDNSYELLRFCVKGSIPGVGSKLFKYFTRNYKPNEIISYCDLRWGTGLFYEKLGFKLSHISEPNYWYFRNQLIRQHRYQFRKQSLIEMNSYSPEKTEWQIMQEEGYDKIYDCGNKVFKWIK